MFVEFDQTLRKILIPLNGNDIYKRKINDKKENINDILSQY